MADVLLPGSGMVVNHFLKAQASISEPMDHTGLSFYVEDCLRVLSRLEDGNSLSSIK